MGLTRPNEGGQFGMLLLRTVGRRTGQERAVILGYVEDGDNLVTLAMNGWGTAEPAWWLNLQANPNAVVDTVDGTRPVRARATVGEERARLWARCGDHAGWGGSDIDSLAARRQRETAVVVLEPDGAMLRLPSRRSLTRLGRWAR
jgi:F420H(2)-dependent quinone reductase